MRILITGHKGFLGRKIQEVLTTGKALEIHGLDCDFDFEKFQELFGDFRRRGGKFDYIIHCGAIADSREQSNLLWQLNYQATTEIADYCKQTDTRLLFISSAAALDSDTPYGWSKQCAEFYLHHKVASMNLCIFRPFGMWSFDESEKCDQTYQNPSIVYKILTGRLEQIYYQCVRDFIHITDVVDAVQQVVHEWTPGIFDIGTAYGTDIETLVDHLYGDKAVWKPPVVYDEPIRGRRVARHDKLLPGWEATLFSEYINALDETLKKRPILNEPECPTGREIL